jgi:hypothetical protein
MKRPLRMVINRKLANCTLRSGENTPYPLSHGKINVRVT